MSAVQKWLKWMSITTSDGCLQNLARESSGVDVSCRQADDGAAEYVIRNQTPNDMHILDVRIDFPLETFAELGMAKQCLQYIHCIDFRFEDGVKPMHVPTQWANVDPSSNLLTVIGNETAGQAILLASLPPYSRGFTWFDVLHEEGHKAGAFRLRIRIDYDLQLKSGESLKLPPLILLRGQRGEDLLEDYTALVRKRSKNARKPNITGWNSWDYYAGAVTRDDMDENRRTCNSIFPNSVEYVVIDEGYEPILGQWEGNEKFPAGLGAYCRATKNEGSRPGLWIAPLFLSLNAPWYRQHSDWCLPNPEGDIYTFESGWGGVLALLDPTRPEVQRWLFETFTRLRGEGFEYFKIDFTQFLLEAGSFWDSSVGKAEVFHLLFELIRKAIGESSYLLACGAPYEAVLGIVDAVRGCGDIHNYSSMLAQCSRSNFGRLWMQRSISNLDPDFLIVRSRETSSEERQNRRQAVTPRTRQGAHWMDGEEFDIEGAKFWALAGYFVGGDFILGDRISALNEEGRQIIRKVLVPGRKPGRWINQFMSTGQRYPVLLTEYEDRYEVGIFNFTCTEYYGEIPVELPFPVNHAIDFWTGEEIQTDKIHLMGETALGMVACPRIMYQCL